MHENRSFFLRLGFDKKNIEKLFEVFEIHKLFFKFSFLKFLFILFNLKKGKSKTNTVKTEEMQLKQTEPYRF